MLSRTVVLALSLLLAVVAWAADLAVVEDWTRLAVGAKGIPDDWKGGQTWGFPKHDFTVANDDGRRALHLQSADESSTVSKDIKGKVKLKETPILEWSWKVVTLPKGADSRSKYTDDQAAQLYVTWPRFPQAVRSRIIGYIWDTTAPQGLFVQSEKTSTVTYVVVRSGPGELGKWLTERRNVVEDYRKIYGEEPDNPGVVSIAIDSDDTHSTAESFFGAIVFRKP
ncbi:MAG: DUF3047 domain-containing protein [Candidatus Rokubacteria bacterium]|nr:DUF3047 domain-containing protein [Candidatus Rokubacteria bacterium]